MVVRLLYQSSFVNLAAMAWLFLSLCSLTWFPAIVISRLCQDREPLSPFTPEFDALVMENLNHWHVPGLSVAVVDDDETFSKVRCSDNEPSACG